MVQRCYQSPFHFQQSYLLAEGSCNDFDSISCTCLYKKLVLVSNPVFFAPLWHSHSLNASRHTKLLELKTISAFSATSYYFDSLLSKFHLATPKLGKMCLCFIAVNLFLGSITVNPNPTALYTMCLQRQQLPEYWISLLCLFAFSLLPLHLAPPPTVQVNIHILNLPVFAGANCSLSVDLQL